MSDSISGGALPVQRRAGIDCGEAVDLIPAMALGAIEPAERLLLIAHCERCVDCSSELDSLSYPASLLALSVPLSTPSSHAKSALFERIAPAAVSVLPPVAIAERFAAPLVSSPGEKRRRKSGETTTVVEDRFAPGPITSPMSRWTGRVSKLAVAPLALALVLVSVYAMQARSDMHDLQAMNASLVSSNQPASAADNSLTGAEVDLATKTVTDVDAVAQPVLYTFSASNGGQTASTRSISPIDSTCMMAGDGTGNYHLQLAGVDLPGTLDTAGVYLQSPTGEPTFLTVVKLDASGSGEATFTYDSAISDNSTLLIGPVSAGSAGAQQVDGGVTFLLTNDDNDTNLMGLGASS